MKSSSANTKFEWLAAYSVGNSDIDRQREKFLKLCAEAERCRELMFKTGLIFAGAAVIAGCAPHVHQLQADSSPALVRGEFIHENPRRLTLRIGDRRYIAEGFEIHRHTNLAELQRRYRNTNPKHWERIFAGHDKSHETYSAEPAPKSADGAELTCQLGWGAGKMPQGACQDKAGAEYQIRFD